jgi:hypothetical protein
MRRHPVLLALASSVGLLASPLVTPVIGVAAASGSSAVSAPVFTPPLSMLGTVTLSSLGPPPTTKSASSGSSRWRVEDQAVTSHRPTAAPVAATPAPTARPVSGTQVPKEYGFVGLTGPEQAAANGGLDLEPPDQGLCAGDGYVTEFINNALTVYNRSGTQALPVIPSYELFKQPSTAFFSDPRCYYDAATGHWFLSEFIVGTVGPSGTATSPSVQFLAVSDTSDPLGTYHVWGWDTTDPSTAGCPCFGDYDELGADDNGIYITTDEFSITGAAYNGVIVYALSKELIETYSNSGIPPTVFGYRVTHDYFGQPYILAPTTTPAGARFAPGTEYFVESNGNALADNHLAVYALNNTSELAAPTPPSLYRTEVTSEPYSFPPDANQKAGPRPLGRSVQDPEGKLQADFDSVMETTYLNGHIYGELDTATASGYDAAAWFQLTPVLSGNTLTATVYHQGYVAAANANLIYPYTALSSNGTGYLLFSLSGPDNYPSAAYISYGTSGPSGPVRIAGAGAEPEDSFTCYAAFVGPDYGGCRWGDYSMGAAANGVVYMATEMVPGTSRDTLTNWGTYVWSAPPPGS